MGKVRRIDWSPAEWLAGTRGLGMDETAVYITVLNIIYDRASTCPNDPSFIASHMLRSGERNRHAMAGLTRRTAAGLQRLIAGGKLRVSEDGRDLTNDRADIELRKASARIDDASTAGRASGRSRTLNARSTHRQRIVNASSSIPQSSHINGLARTPVPIINHQPSLSSLRDTITGPARAAEPSLSLGPAHGIGPPPTGAPDPAAVEKAIRDLGIDPANVPSPPPAAPPDNGGVIAPRPSMAERLAERAAAARRKLLEGE